MRRHARGTDRASARPDVPWFAESVDEAERLERTGWPVGVDAELDEPDAYTDAELASWGYAPSSPERRRTWPSSPEAATTAVVARGMGRVVKRYRWRRGWSQRTLAARLGTDQPGVSRMEQGRVTSVTVAQLARLAIETGCVVTLCIVPASAPGHRGQPYRRIMDDREPILPGGGVVQLAVDVPARFPSPPPPPRPSRRRSPGLPVERLARTIP